MNRTFCDRCGTTIKPANTYVWHRKMPRPMDDQAHFDLCPDCDAIIMARIHEDEFTPRYEPL